MKKKILIGIGILFFVFVIIAAVGGKDNNMQDEKSSVVAETKDDPSSSAIPESIEIRDLADDFDSNQVAAEAKWKDRFVKFSANISNISDLGISFSNISSKQFSFTQVICKVEDKQQLLNLKNGETITVQGKVGKQTIGVIDVTECQVIE